MGSRFVIGTFFCNYDDYEKLEKKINMLIVETENRLSERDMEEELYPSRLSIEYNNIQFAIVNKDYDISKDLWGMRGKKV